MLLSEFMSLDDDKKLEHLRETQFYPPRHLGGLELQKWYETHARDGVPGNWADRPKVVFNDDAQIEAWGILHEEADKEEAA